MGKIALSSIPGFAQWEKKELKENENDTDEGIYI